VRPTSGSVLEMIYSPTYDEGGGSRIHSSGAGTDRRAHYSLRATVIYHRSSFVDPTDVPTGYCHCHLDFSSEGVPNAYLYVHRDGVERWVSVPNTYMHGRF
jgi:hypothetical protein